MARIDAFLKLGTQQGCSDVHLAVGVPPMLRMHGDLLPIKFRELRASELESYVAEILTRSQNEIFARGTDLDFSYVSAEGGRFRVNVYRKETGIGATFRTIPADVPTLEKLRAAADRHQAVRLPPGHGAGDRLDRHRQVDHARGDDRSPQPDAAAEHHQPRGPDRVRAPEQEQPGDPARARHAHPELRRRACARRCARTRT